MKMLGGLKAVVREKERAKRGEKERREREHGKREGKERREREKG